MTANDVQRVHMEEPLAELERQFLREYVTGAGQDLDALLARDDEEAKKILTEASRYATAKLTEVESRSRYVRQLHGER